MHEQLLERGNEQVSGEQRMRFNGVRSLNLRDLSFELFVPSLTAITGASGSGKTALLINTIYEESLRALTPGLSFQTRRQLSRPLFSDVQSAFGLRPAMNLGALAQSASRNQQSLEEAIGLAPILQQLATLIAMPRCNKASCGLQLADPEASAQLLRSDIQASRNCGLILFGGLVPIIDAGFNKKGSVAKRVLESTVSVIRFLVDEGYQRFLVAGKYFRFEEADQAAIFQVLAEHPPPVSLKTIHVVLSSMAVDGALSPAQDRRFVTEFHDAFSAGFSRAFALGIASKHALITGKLVGDTSSGIYREVLDGFHCKECGRAVLRGDLLAMQSKSNELALYLNGPELSVFRSLSPALLGSHLKSLHGNSVAAEPWLEKAEIVVNRLSEVGLSHIPISRRVCDLSDGERIKFICALFPPTETSDVALLFDEPSRWLHPADLGGFWHWSRAQVAAGNTVIVTERNEDFLALADDVVALGDMTGENRGGHIIFHGSGEKWKAAGSKKNVPPAPDPELKAKVTPMVSARMSGVDFPLRSLVAIVGRVGSGKTRFLRDAVAGLKTSTKTVAGATTLRAVYVGSEWLTSEPNTKRRKGQRAPLVVDSLDLIRSIAELYAQLPLARRAGFSVETFMLREEFSRCSECFGAGFVFSGADFIGAGVEECGTCAGRRFDERVLSCVFNERSIVDVFSASVAEAFSLFSVNAEISLKLQLLQNLGLGSLRLGAPVEFISSSDRQRLHLAAHINNKSPKSKLLLLDQTLSGLDEAAVFSALACLRRFVSAGGSVGLVTHDPGVIQAADAVLELSTATKKIYSPASDYPLDYFSFLRETWGP